MTPPGRGDGRVFTPPGTVLELAERDGRGLGVHGAVHGLERQGDRFTVLPAGIVHRVAEQMHDAGLDLRVREHRADGVREALQAIDDGNQQVVDAAIAQLAHHPHPELCPLGLLDPDPEHVLAPVRRDADRQIHGLVAHRPLVAHLDPQGVEKHDRVERVQRPCLPTADFLEHRVGHRGDQLRRGLNAVQLAQMTLDVAHAHAAGVHRDDLVIEAGKATLVLRDQLRFEGPAPVARDLELDLARVRDDRLLAVAVAMVAARLSATPRARCLALEVLVHLGVEHPFCQRLLDLGHQTFGGKDLLRIRALQQLIHQFVLDRHDVPPAGSMARSHRNLDSGIWPAHIAASHHRGRIFIVTAVMMEGTKSLLNANRHRHRHRRRRIRLHRRIRLRQRT